MRAPRSQLFPHHTMRRWAEGVRHDAIRGGSAGVGTKVQGGLPARGATAAGGVEKRLRIPHSLAYLHVGERQPAGEDRAKASEVSIVAKGLPTLPTKLVEKVWNFEFVEMEEFLPEPRSLRIVEQGSSSQSFQDSLGGALSQFQARQQHNSQC